MVIITNYGLYHTLGTSTPSPGATLPRAAFHSELEYLRHSVRALKSEKQEREHAVNAARAALAEVAELRQWKELAARQLAAAQLQLEGRGASTSQNSSYSETIKTLAGENEALKAELMQERQRQRCSPTLCFTLL